MCVRSHLILVLTASMAVLAGCTGKAPAPTVTADTIYTGGDIVTVNDAQPTAEAVAVKDGRILAVGSRADVESAYKGQSTRVVDLAGRTLTPGFVDPHSHFAMALDMADQVNASAPPVGPASTPEQIVAEIRKFIDARQINRVN